MKRIVLLALAMAIAMGIGGYFFIKFRREAHAAAEEEEAARMLVIEEKLAKQKQLPKPEVLPGTEHYPFEIYVETQLQSRAQTYDEATAYAQAFVNASVLYRKSNEVVWDNFLAFNVYYETDEYAEFDTFGEAVAFAADKERALIYYRRNNALIWENIHELPPAFRISDVRAINQNPELPRGCEVTSLAMLLQYYGAGVTKNELAEKINKDDTEHRVVDGKIYAGNPNTGFVGDMSNRSVFGFGVYHKPIYELLRYYRPRSAMDLTGCYFDALQRVISMGRPVWIITNTDYSQLPPSAFEQWTTPLGEISVTRKEHSVLVTGYDEERIYFNDPLSGERSAARNDFIMAWEQMGRQAVALAE